MIGLLVALLVLLAAATVALLWIRRDHRRLTGLDADYLRRRDQPPIRTHADFVRRMMDRDG